MTETAPQSAAAPTRVRTRLEIVEELRRRLREIDRVLTVARAPGYIDVDGLRMLPDLTEQEEVFAVIGQVLSADELVHHPVSVWGAGPRKLITSPSREQLAAALVGTAGPSVQVAPTTAVNHQERATYAVDWADGAPRKTVEAVLRGLGGDRPAQQRLVFLCERRLGPLGLTCAWYRSRSGGGRGYRQLLDLDVDLRDPGPLGCWATLSPLHVHALFAAADADLEGDTKVAGMLPQHYREWTHQSLRALDRLAKRCGGPDAALTLVAQILGDDHRA